MSNYRLFDVLGIELEYMIVDRETLDVRPIADQILTAAAGELTSDFIDGPITWSNELALHVIELKTTEPVESLVGVAEQFQVSVRRINELADRFNAVLLPTGMHPWMDPFRELTLWPHDSATIYQAFNRIFDCRGHGWANLQSMHLNLPFCGDEEFGRLHAAIRLLLPLLPGLACSSPIADRQWTGFTDYRMEVYRQNAAKIPEVAGRIVPEGVFTAADYEQQIYQPMYRAIAPFDHDGILQRPFLNARGAIARFDRGSIEIRVIDTQEQPAADLAIAELVVATLRALVDERWTSWSDQRAMPTETLAAGFRAALRSGERTTIADPVWLAHLGMSPQACTLSQLWAHLANVRSTATPAVLTNQRLGADQWSTTPVHLGQAAVKPLETIFGQGTLARRILGTCGIDPAKVEGPLTVDSARLHSVYDRLRCCLQDGVSFPIAGPVA